MKPPTQITVSTAQMEELQRLLHVEHEHCDGRNECHICDEPLLLAAIKEIKRLRLLVPEEQRTCPFQFAVLGFKQVDYRNLRGMALPIARLRQEPENLERMGLQFYEDRDDLDYLRVAAFSTATGRRFCLVRHRHQPLPGTDILTNEKTQSISDDLTDALDALALSRDDLTWAHPDVKG